jgi:hypothetical protein
MVAMKPTSVAATSHTGWMSVGCRRRFRPPLSTELTRSVPPSRQDVAQVACPRQRGTHQARSEAAAARQPRRRPVRPCRPPGHVKQPQIRRQSKSRPACKSSYPAHHVFKQVRRSISGGPIHSRAPIAEPHGFSHTGSAMCARPAMWCCPPYCPRNRVGRAPKTRAGDPQLANSVERWSERAREGSESTSCPAPWFGAALVSVRRRHLTRT